MLLSNPFGYLWLSPRVFQTNLTCPGYSSLARSSSICRYCSPTVSCPCPAIPAEGSNNSMQCIEIRFAEPDET